MHGRRSDNNRENIYVMPNSHPYANDRGGRSVLERRATPKQRIKNRKC